MFIPLAVLHQGNRIFKQLRNDTGSAWNALFVNIVPLALIPPIFAYFGSSRTGWLIGADEVVTLSQQMLVLICGCYLVALLGGLVGSAFILKWMAPTYAADRQFAKHLALMSSVATPLVLGSIVHLYPHLVLNMLVVIPMLIWSMYLLYKGLPIVLDTTNEQGMLMASSLIGVLLVGAVTLLGITVVLWTYGVGPTLGI